MSEPEQPPTQPGPISDPPGFGQPPAPDATPAYGAVPPQYGAPPGYYGYGYGYPSPRSGTNGMAIAAMICGICGFVCVVPGLVGIILGFVSLPQIKRSGQSGRGMAITGIVLGALWIVALILVLVFAHHTSQPLDTGGDGAGV